MNTLAFFLIRRTRFQAAGVNILRLSARIRGIDTNPQG